LGKLASKEPGKGELSDSIWAAGWAVSTVAVLGAGAAVLANVRQHGSTAAQQHHSCIFLDELKDCRRL